MNNKLLKKYTIYIPLIVLSNLFLIVVPLLFSYLIDNIIANENYAVLPYWLTITLLFSTISELCKCYFVNYFPIKLGIKNTIKLCKMLLTSILKMDYTSFRKKDKDFYYNTVTNSAATYGDLHVVLHLLLIANVISIVLLVIIAFILNIFLGIGVLLYIPLLIIITIKKSKPLYKLNKEVMKMQDAYIGSIKSIIENKEQINILKVDEYYLNKGEQHQIKFGQFMERYRFHTTLSEFFPGIVSNIYSVVLLGLSALLIQQGLFTPGLLLMSYQYVGIISSPLLDVCDIIVRYKSNQDNISRVEEVYMSKDDVPTNPNAILNDNFLELEDFKYYIHSNQQFLFECKQKLILPKNGLYILKGSNGTGKSMLFNLILGIEKSNHCFGNISVAKDINKYAYLSYPHIFIDGSFKDNMLGIPMDTHLLKVLNIDFLDKEINVHPLNLSLGQQQKIGLLRVLSSPSNYIFLDEPITNLDKDTWFNLKEYLKQISKRKTIFVIMHDNSLDEFASEILYIDNNQLFISDGK